MPLRAISNDTEYIAPLMDDTQWQDLEQRVKNKSVALTLPCCDNIAYLRTSKYGVRHFVHKSRGDCTSALETWQHLLAKQQIVWACQHAGYSASTEVSGNGWRADVLATKDKARIAFEVQWSPQSLEETQARQARYKEASVRGCWFFKKLPSEDQAQDLPMFPLEVTENGCFIHFEIYEEIDGEFYPQKRTISLYDFVVALLSSKVRFCSQLTAIRRQNVRFKFVEKECSLCEKQYHIYYIQSERKSHCGQFVEEISPFAPEIMAAARGLIKIPSNSHIKLGTIKERYSKTAQESYMSFGCYYCHAWLGRFFYHSEIVYDDDESVTLLETEVTFKSPLSIPHNHWCFPQDGKFCCS